MDALGVWLSKRLEAAHAAAAATETSGSLGRPLDTSPRRIGFEKELADVQGRQNAQRQVMAQLYTRLFTARGKGAAVEQVGAPTFPGLLWPSLAFPDLL